jgi:hypothetical protein
MGFISQKNLHFICVYSKSFHKKGWTDFLNSKSIYSKMLKIFNTIDDTY